MTIRAFDISGGLESMRRSPGVLTTYLIIVVGIVAHWVWSVLVAGLPTNGPFDFGAPVVWAARLALAFIAAAFSFTGIYKQVAATDQKVRAFATFTYGFAVDAFTGPVVDAATSTGTAAG